jgi:hypothetical protein
VDESLDTQEKALNKTYFGPINRKWSKPKGIFQNLKSKFESDFYMVMWQSYPVIPLDYPSYSWDFWEYLGISAEEVLETHKAVISYTYGLPDPKNAEEVAYETAYAEYLQDYLPPGRQSDEPNFEIYYVSCYIKIYFGKHYSSHLCFTHVTYSRTAAFEGY